MTISQPPVKPVLVKDPDAVSTWTITICILIIPVLFIVIPLFGNFVSTLNRADAYKQVVATLTSQIKHAPVVDKAVSYYVSGTDFGSGGATRTDHLLVYPGKYTDILLPVAQDLQDRGYDCTAEVDEKGNTLNALDPSATIPITTLDYTKITNAPDDYDTAGIARCAGGDSYEYAFYNSTYHGAPATIIYVR